MTTPKPWKTWGRKAGLNLSILPREELRQMQEQYDKLPDGVEREVFRGEWAAKWADGPKDKLIYGLGHRLCRRPKHGWTQDEFTAWEQFVLEDAWSKGAATAHTDWAVDGSQLLAICENKRYEKPTLKQTGYVKIFRIEDQPIQVVRTWAVHWSKFLRRNERVDAALKRFGDYIRFGSWEDGDEHERQT